MKLRSIAGIAGATIVCLGLFAIAATAASTDTSERVEASAQRLVEHELDLQRQPDSSETPGLGVSRDLAEYVDAASGDEFIVDEDSGLILAYSNRIAAERLTTREASDGVGRSFSNAEAVLRARHVAQRLLPSRNLDAMRVEIETRMLSYDPGGNPVEEMVVEFRRFLGEVPTLDCIRVTLNPEALEVISVHQAWDAGVEDVRTTPEVSGDDALAAISKQFSMPVYSVDNVELCVMRHPVTMEPALLWSVAIHTGDGGFGASAMGVVDALTGELVDGAVSD